MRAADRAAAAFATQHGTAPESVWSAPGRVNLIGEHTDYNDGYVLPLALPHRTAVACSPRHDGMLTLSTIGLDGEPQVCAPLAVTELEPGAPGGWAAYPAGVAWVLRRSGIALRGADLVIAGDVPTGAGLSSSAALECATALALLDTVGLGRGTGQAPALTEIARWTQRAENEFAGAPTGVLDQTASLACTEAHALFFDVRSGHTEQVPFAAGDADLELLVIDTRASHSHSESGYGERRKGCEQAARILDVDALRDIAGEELADTLALLPEELRPLVRHVVTENERVLSTVRMMREGRLAETGELLTASHFSLRDDYRVSCAELDVAVDAALETGALGARMTGGGFGGSAIALVPARTRETVEQGVIRAFRRRGFAEPRLFAAVPSAGAGRDR